MKKIIFIICAIFLISSSFAFDFGGSLHEDFSITGISSKDILPINNIDFAFWFKTPIDFQGNTNYNPSTSERTTFKTELYEYYINFTNNDIVNNEIATYNDYANLKVKLRKKSLLDETYYDINRGLNAFLEYLKKQREI